MGDSQPDITYYIGSGVFTVQDGFETDQASCEVTYSLAEEGTGSYDTSLFTFDPSSPLVEIEADNIVYHM